MPELPEVETVARQLAPCLQGRTVRGFRILDPRLREGRTPPLARRRILHVGRSGKRVLIRFSARPQRDDPLWLAVHLRMTGRLLWSDSAPGPMPHLRARFSLDRGQLLFVDTRRFGTMSWYRAERDAAPAGVDPLSPDLDPTGLAELLGNGAQNMKAWLLRQDKLVGLGNIYASEILYAARISPLREARSLRRPEIGRLYNETRRILQEAIDNCGTTFSDFQDARGVEGEYQQFLGVYGRDGERCFRCRGRVRRVVQQQRSTFYCPRCQR